MNLFNILTKKKLPKNVSPSQTSKHDIPQKFQAIFNALDAYFPSLANSKVIDLGTSPSGDLASLMTDRYDLSEFVGINPVCSREVKTGKTQLHKSFAEKIDRPDDYFDYGISVAAFEHFHSLDKSLIELERVLKPGGMFFTLFGPIWSGPWGHHLWKTIEGQTYTYNNTFLPPYSHLIFEHDKLSSLIREKYKLSKEVANQMTNYVLTSEEQNRLFYSDYLSIFNNSKLEIIFCYGSSVFPLNENRYSNLEAIKNLNTVKKKYPEKSGFEYNCIFLLARKKHIATNH